jgi:hypothetical protein
MVSPHYLLKENSQSLSGFAKWTKINVQKTFSNLLLEVFIVNNIYIWILNLKKPRIIFQSSLLLR